MAPPLRREKISTQELDHLALLASQIAQGKRPRKEPLNLWHVLFTFVGVIGFMVALAILSRSLGWH